MILEKHTHPCWVIMKGNKYLNTWEEPGFRAICGGKTPYIWYEGEYHKCKSLMKHLTDEYGKDYFRIIKRKYIEIREVI